MSVKFQSIPLFDFKNPHCFNCGSSNVKITPIQCCDIYRFICHNCSEVYEVSAINLLRASKERTSKESGK